MDADRLHPLARKDRFLFAPADPVAVALFRMALAITLPVFFWSAGMEPAAIVRPVPGAAALYENVFLGWLYWGLIAAAAVWFGLGWHARPAGFLLVALLIPLYFVIGRRPSRQILLLALIAFSFLRSDAALGLRNGFTRRPIFAAGPMWPIRLIQLQLSVLYGVNAMAKMSPEYLSGEILLGMAQSLPNFLEEFPGGAFRRGPLAVPVAGVAVATVATEAFLAVGFWFRRLRWVAAAVGLAFHLALLSVVDIHMLGWATLFLYLAFLLPFEDSTTVSGTRMPLLDRSAPAGIG